MMEFAVSLMLGSTAIVIGSMFLYLVAERLGFVRPGLKSPTMKVMKLIRSVPDYTRQGTSITFHSPKTVLLPQEGGRDIIDTGFYVAVPDGYCGVLTIRTEGYVDSSQRPHRDIGTGYTFLPPRFEGPIMVEIWNKSFEEPAGMDRGLPMADLHLVPVPDTLRVVDSI